MGFDLKGEKELTCDGVAGRGTAGTKSGRTGRTAMGEAERQRLSQEEAGPVTLGLTSHTDEFHWTPSASRSHWKGLITHELCLKGSLSLLMESEQEQKNCQEQSPGQGHPWRKMLGLAWYSGKHDSTGGLSRICSPVPPI